MSTQFAHMPVQHKQVSIPVAQEAIYADLAIPNHCTGVVLFAHGSGSSRLSGRNKAVANVLNMAGFATLLLDLLTPVEAMADESTHQYRFDISRLAQRLVLATQWVQAQDALQNLPIGYFGASTGAAAALIAAAQCPQAIQTVVSRGGRPDMAGAALPSVQCPTLLIVGSLDHQVIEMNKTAMAQMICPKTLTIVPGATHLFEEPGTLEAVSQLAAEWFSEHLVSVPTVAK